MVAFVVQFWHYWYFNDDVVIDTQLFILFYHKQNKTKQNSEEQNSDDEDRAKNPIQRMIELVCS